MAVAAYPQVSSAQTFVSTTGQAAQPLPAAGSAARLAARRIAAAVAVHAAGHARLATSLEGNEADASRDNTNSPNSPHLYVINRVE